MACLGHTLRVIPAVLHQSLGYSAVVGQPGILLRLEADVLGKWGEGVDGGAAKGPVEGTSPWRVLCAPSKRSVLLPAGGLC